MIAAALGLTRERVPAVLLRCHGLPGTHETFLFIVHRKTGNSPRNSQAGSVPPEGKGN